MKYLILLLLSFNAYSMTKIEYGHNDPKYAKQEIVKETKELALKELKKIIKKSKWMKGEWSAITNELGIKRKIERELTLLEEGAELIGLTEEEFEYYSPANFTVEITDVTEEYEAKKLEREEKKKERKKLRESIQEIKDSELPESAKKLLIHYAKSLKE